MLMKEYFMSKKMQIYENQSESFDIIHFYACADIKTNVDQFLFIWHKKSVCRLTGRRF
jgi:hypothetical protein